MDKPDNAIELRHGYATASEPDELGQVAITLVVTDDEWEPTREFAADLIADVLTATGAKGASLGWFRVSDVR